MTINDRIRFFRKEIKQINQKQFADCLGLTQSGVSYMEQNGSTVSDSSIKTICSVYNVSEEWLREGKGEMFVQRTRNQVITDFAGDLINEPESFRTRFIEAMAKLDESDWEDIERIVEKILENKEG